jgi:hypothetical protein
MTTQTSYTISKTDLGLLNRTIAIKAQISTDGKGVGIIAVNYTPWRLTATFGDIPVGLIDHVTATFGDIPVGLIDHVTLKHMVINFIAETIIMAGSSIRERNKMVNSTSIDAEAMYEDLAVIGGYNEPSWKFKNSAAHAYHRERYLNHEAGHSPFNYKRYL